MILDPFENLPAEDGVLSSGLVPSIHVGIFRGFSGNGSKAVVRVPSINANLDMPPCLIAMHVNVGNLFVGARVLVAFVDSDFEQMFVIGQLNDSLL